jgi:hypothetical protein
MEEIAGNRWSGRPDRTAMTTWEIGGAPADGYGC